MSKSHQLLINRCRKGDEKAMMKVYDLYCDAMFKIACRYLNYEDAKDAMQESFLKAFTRLDSYMENYSFGSWLKRIVINQCIDTLKKRQLEFVDTEHFVLSSEDESEDWDFDTTITKEHIVKAIDQMPQKFRVVVKLYLIEGYDHQEISDILNIPVKTSRTHLFRGRKQLQKHFKSIVQ